MKKNLGGIVTLLIIAIMFIAGNKYFEAKNPDMTPSQNNTSVTPTNFQQIAEKKNLKLVNGEEKVTIQVEVARKSEELRIGLMNRTSLDSDKGMLFVFPYESPESFWMQNTLIPLDIAYFDASGKFVNVSTNAAPCVGRGDDCPTYPSNGSIKYVLETKAGSIKENLYNQNLSIENISEFR